MATPGMGLGHSAGTRVSTEAGRWRLRWGGGGGGGASCWQRQQIPPKLDFSDDEPREGGAACESRDIRTASREVPVTVASINQPPICTSGTNRSQPAPHHWRLTVEGVSKQLLEQFSEAWDQDVPTGHYFVIADTQTATGNVSSTVRFHGLIPAGKVLRKATRRQADDSANAPERRTRAGLW
jgi:hypothetical protein